MNKAKPSALITFDSMRDINRGYYSFGKGLGKALIERNQGRYNLHYYLFRDTPYLFEGKVKIVFLSLLDKLWFRRKNDFEIVHFSDQRCRLAPSKLNAKKILTIHDMNKVHLKKSKPYRIKAYLKKLKKSIDQCDKVVTISNFVANDIKHYFPDAIDKVSVIYNGADKLYLSKDHEPHFKPKKQFIFTIGLLSPQKGFHHLPALLANTDYDLIISGIETNHKAVILENAVKFTCADRVHLTGEISDDDKAWYYKNCSAFVFPSMAEGFGLPVIEAMHFGKPVFLSKFTSLPEVGGNAAYYFDNFDPKHMRQVFENGMDDFANNNRAQDVVVQADKFSWERAADHYFNLYKELLDENR